ncbi:MAG: DUF6544 family protein [Actinomycetota bacterium]
MTAADISPERTPAELGEPIELPDTVPSGFVRFAHAVFGPTIPRVETFALRGPARMRIGRGPWLPLRAATYHRIGRGFAAEFDMTVGGRTVFSGRDSFIDGRAVSWIGGRRQPSSPDTDRSANAFRWLEAGMLPTSWLLPGVELQEIDELTLRLIVPGDGTPITWRLDPITGMPWRLEAPRYRTASDGPIPWRADLGPWRTFGPMVWFSSIDAVWADQARPWLRWTIEDVEPGADVDEVLHRHAAA